MPEPKYIITITITIIIIIIILLPLTPLCYIHVVFIEGTPYEGGQFHVQLFLPDKYPIRAPLAYFVTKIWHPNIDYLGRICLDTLGKKWSAAFLIDKVALSLLVLLQSPNADDPLDINIAEQFRNNPEAAKKKAAQWTKLFAQKKV